MKRITVNGIYVTSGSDMAKLSSIEEPRRQEMRFPAALLADVDRWRGALPGVPNRSEAIRRLVASSLKAETQGNGGDNEN